MVVGRLLIMGLVMLLSVLGMVACTSGVESKAGAVVPSTAPATVSNQVQSNEGVVVATTPISATATVSNQVQSSEGVVVATTPMSATQLALQPPGQSEPGASASDDEGQAEPETQGEQPAPGTMVIYTDNTYPFSVSYPANFVFRIQPAEKLGQLTPTPTAAFIIMNPVTAASDLGDLEPADLEIRAYAAEQSAALDDWLTANRLLPADGSVPLQPFQTANISGVELCAATLIAPGCSYFVMASGWVYQLTPATLEGESLIDTFRLMP